MAVTGCAALLAAAPTVWAAPESAPAAQDCEAGLLPGAEDLRRSLPADVDSSGRYVVADAIPAEGEPTRIQLWDGDELIDPGIEAEQQAASGVNAAGTLIGYYPTDNNRPSIPLQWTDGEIVELPIPGDAPGAVTQAINDDGDIVGYAETISENPTAADRTPVKWNAPGEVVDLELPGDANGGAALDVAADGTAVGYYMDAEHEVQRPYLWNADGSGEELPAHFAGTATAIGGDYIVGHNQDDEWPVIWQRGEDDFQELHDGGKLSDVTPDGDALGYNESGHFLLNDEGETPLLDEDGGATTSEDLTTAVSDAGDVVAGALADREALPQATVWGCG